MKHNEKPLSDEHRPTPGKKNTKRWCKGKVGREHQPALRIASPYTRVYQCGWVKDSWRMAIHKRFGPGDGGPYWECDHEQYCQACGKILLSMWSNKIDCPDYTEDKSRHHSFVPGVTTL